MSNFGKERQTGTVTPNVTSTSSRPMSITISSKLTSMARPMLLQFGSSSAVSGPVLRPTKRSRSSYSSNISFTRTSPTSSTAGNIPIFIPVISTSLLAPPCCFLIQNSTKQVKKSVVTQPIFIPQRSFTPLRKANDERSLKSLISSDLDHNYADHDVKTGRDFLNYISLYSQHSPLELILVHRSQLVQNNALAPLELYISSGVQPHKSLPAQKIAHSTFEFCCAHVQSEASSPSF